MSSQVRWNVPEKLTAQERKLVARMRRKSRFYVFLREIRGQLFDAEFQEELARAYAPRGQAPVPPVLLAMVCLLQAYTGVSDAEAVDEAEMDMRWQLVLGTLGQDKAPFGQGSLPRFREPLMEHDLDPRLLDRTVELARQTGLFGWHKLKAALDSSPLAGCGRVEDSWNLIGHAMSRLVAVIAQAAQIPAAQIVEEAEIWVLEGSSIKATLDIDWGDEEQRSEALHVVVNQANGLLDWAREHRSMLMQAPEVREATQFLERILSQDTEPDPERPNKVRIKHGVAKNRVCSVGDPEMRHGRKSRTKAFNGYKRYVATHVDVPLILAAEAMPANTPEHDSVDNASRVRSPTWRTRRTRDRPRIVESSRGVEARSLRRLDHLPAMADSEQARLLHKARLQDRLTQSNCRVSRRTKSHLLHEEA